jgi:asparagine synthase (glutamine-hydrolysing)
LGRHRARSWCFRDRAAGPPPKLAADNSEFAHNAQPGSLAVLAGHRRPLHVAARADVDPQAIFDYLYFHVIPSPRTVFQGVHRLPPGTALVRERPQLTVRPYWTPRFAEPARRDFDAWRRVPPPAEGRRGAQLDGSKPACFLSGGTDSSTVAGMIGEVAGRAAATYSIGFEAEGYDEMAVRAHRGQALRHRAPRVLRHARRPGAQHPAGGAHYDQPFGNSSVLPAYYCAAWRATTA